jgi:hypothetical protein
MLSEHTLEGMLEGYLLSGRNGFLSSYEAFVHVIDSMFNQHAKWLSICNQLSWRRKIASLNLLITSTVWRQDHNGFTHQDPGFLDIVVNKSAAVTRIYLPPDSNCLLSVANHCLRSENYINVIVSDKQLHLQYSPATFMPSISAPMCSGANALISTMAERTSGVISTGSSNRGPPWTTRCPTTLMSEAEAIAHVSPVHAADSKARTVSSRDETVSFSFLTIPFEFFTTVAAVVPVHSIFPSHRQVGGCSGSISPIS